MWAHIHLDPPFPRPVSPALKALERPTLSSPSLPPLALLSPPPPPPLYLQRLTQSSHPDTPSRSRIVELRFSLELPADGCTLDELDLLLLPADPAGPGPQSSQHTPQPPSIAHRPMPGQHHHHQQQQQQQEHGQQQQQQQQEQLPLDMYGWRVRRVTDGTKCQRASSYHLCAWGASGSSHTRDLLG